jgi:hypothetical protein
MRRGKRETVVRKKGAENETGNHENKGEESEAGKEAAAT